MNYPKNETFTVDDITYELTQRGSSDMAFQSLRTGYNRASKAYLAETISELDSGAYGVSSEMTERMVENCINKFSTLDTTPTFLLKRFASTEQGLPWLLVVACPQIQDERDDKGQLVRSRIDVAKDLVGRMDAKQVGEVFWLAMSAGGVLAAKN